MPLSAPSRSRKSLIRRRVSRPCSASWRGASILTLPAAQAEQDHFTLLMMRANEAYSRGDAETLQRLLDDHREISAAAGESDALTLQRVTRQIQHAEETLRRSIANRRHCWAARLASSLQTPTAASPEGRDLLDELAASLRERIADAQYRLEFTERQMSAYGR